MCLKIACCTAYKNKKYQCFYMKCDKLRDTTITLAITLSNNMV